MNPVARLRNQARRFLQLYSPTRLKSALWSREFATGRWSCFTESRDDFIYPILYRHLHKGSLLDLGCGPGTTGLELEPEAYTCYVGVDIADAAVEAARTRAASQGRLDKNNYEQGAIEAYQPGMLFDVILFRDSLYYVRMARVVAQLERYAENLTSAGVFVVRLHTTAGACGLLTEAIQNNFCVIETESSSDGALALVFKPAPKAHLRVDNAHKS